MLADVKTKGSRIKHLRKVRRLTQEEFAAGLDGVTRGAVGNWERNLGVKTENLEQIAVRYVASLDWLATGRGQEPAEGDEYTPPGDGKAITRPRTVDVPEMETRAGAGAGGIAFEEFSATSNGLAVSADLVRDRWSIPSAYVRGQLRITGNAAVIEISGDSGYDPAQPSAPGSLFPGDRVVVDLGDQSPSPSGPFLVWDGVGLVVKLVEIVRGTIDPARIRLSSRNPGYKPYEATEDEARIIGRVKARISAM